jgi:hypothetical protein
MTDGLSTLYQDLLGGSYDCVDRIVLNAYFRMGHDPGGFRVWWRALTGSHETLENAYLMRLAGRFSRRIRAIQYSRRGDNDHAGCGLQVNNGSGCSLLATHASHAAAIEWVPAIFDLDLLADMG